MKCLTFGALLQILYLARAQGETNNTMCQAVFAAYGEQSSCNSADAGHYKNGSLVVPRYLINTVVDLSEEQAINGFSKCVVPRIKETKKKNIVLSIKEILEEDNLTFEDTVIGYSSDYSKGNIVGSNVFNLAELLANVFYFSIKEHPNDKFNAKAEINEEYFEHFSSKETIIFEDKKYIVVDKSLPNTINDSTFDNIFNNVFSTKIPLANPTSVDIYQVSNSNCLFRFSRMKEYLMNHIGEYIFSRSRINNLKETGNPSEIGVKAFKRFTKEYNASAETMLGEMLLYVFLEQALHAPKIMSKIEIEDLGNIISTKSDGIHLLTESLGNQNFHKLVFGASNIVGNLESAVDRVFEKIINIEKNHDKEMQVIDNTRFCNIYDDDTRDYLITLMRPTKNSSEVTEMAFGAFLGYTLDLGYEENNSYKYKIAIKEKMKNDILNVQKHIEDLIIKNNLSGYNFYFYVVPFNDANSEKKSLVEEMIWKDD